MSDGQFSSKPLRSERSREVANAYSTEPMLSADVTQAFLQSPAVRRKTGTLLNLPFPEIGQNDCTPLDARTPKAAAKLGDPMASATLAQEYLIGLVFLRIAGWMFIAFGVVFVLSALGMGVTTLFNRRNPQDADQLGGAIVVATIGLGIGAVGAWFGIFRGRVVTERCWFCPNGMIWMTDGYFDWYKWEDVPDVFCDAEAERPAIGISLGRNVSWISFSNTDASRLLVENIEKQASAACLPSVLQQIAEGRTFRFGPWSLSRTHLGIEQRETAWENVIEVECNQREVFISRKEAGNVTVVLEEIPFPSLFTVLAMACFAHSRERAM